MQPTVPQPSKPRQPTESLVNHKALLKRKVHGELPIESQMTKSKSDIHLQEMQKRVSLSR
jgi:hypothetical protein